jgi:hypothetical protein
MLHFDCCDPSKAAVKKASKKGKKSVKSDKGWAIIYFLPPYAMGFTVGNRSLWVWGMNLAAEKRFMKS